MSGEANRPTQQPYGRAQSLADLELRLLARMDEDRKQILSHVDSQFDDLKKHIDSGFPNGDPGRHREVHEGYIKEAQDRRELWKSVREKTISSAVWAGLMLVAAAVYNYLIGGKS